MALRVGVEVSLSGRDGHRELLQIPPCSQLPIMSSTSDTQDSADMPPWATSTSAVASRASQRLPSPGLQGAEDVLTERRFTTNPRNVSAVSALATGVTLTPVPQVVHPEPSTKGSTTYTITVGRTAPAAGTTGAAAVSRPPATDPSSDSEDEDDLPIPKYLDPEWAKTGVPDTKFYKDYAPDAWCQEAAPNARVWKIYREEMTRIDTETLESWNGTLDVLLIFAGLFSAVSTAFIIESYKSLQPDYAQYIANYIYTSASSNPGAGSLPLPSIRSMGPPDNYVHPSATQRWTNGLWFTSLVVSLTVALLCILVKQWLDQYQARMKRSVPSLLGWSRRHQIYYPGLNRWGVPSLISLLPLLLHISLFLFFAGLVLFLWPLDGPIAFTLLAILAVTLLFYLLAMVVPAIYIDCPSYTPLLAQARSLIILGLRLLHYCSSLSVLHYRILLKIHIVQRIVGAISHANDELEKLLVRSKQPFARETSIIEAQQFILDGQALNALLVSTNDPDVIDAGVEAVGAVTAEAALEVVRREGPLDVIKERTRQDLLSAGDVPSAFAVLTDARRLRTVCALETPRELWLHCNRKIAGFARSLGLDGVMLQATLYGLTNSRVCLLDAERRLYEGLLPHFAHLTDAKAGNRSSLLRHRQLPPGLDSTTCQLFLRFMPVSGFRRHAVPCRLLAFCAGDFAKAEPHERASAIRNLLGVLEREFGAPEAPNGSVTAPNADDAARDALYRLFHLIASSHEILSDEDVARPFIHHLGLVSLSVCSSRGLWPLEQLAGFAAFTQLPSFAHNVSSVALHAYIHVLRLMFKPGDGETELSQQYWTCVATLLELQRISHPMRPGDVDHLSNIEQFFAHPGRAIIAFQGASDTVLLKFIKAATTLDSRVKSTAEALSCLLCHRLRIRPLADELVQPLFSGTFLTNQIRNSMSGIQWLLQPEDAAQRIMTLTRHCARLAASNPVWSGSVSSRPLDPMLLICDDLENPGDVKYALEEDGLALVAEIIRGPQPGGASNPIGSGALAETGSRPLDPMLRICDELENPSDVKYALEDDALALVAEIRRGLQPGGELLAECDPSCDCWPQPQPPEPTTWSTRWRNRILGRISAGPESAV